METTKTESEETKSITRKVYLRGSQMSKRVLVLLEGTVYESPYEVAWYKGREPLDCTVVRTENGILVSWDFHPDTEYYPTPVFDKDDVRLEFSVDTIAETMDGIVKDTYTELWSYVPTKGEAPSLKKAMKTLSLASRRNIEEVFTTQDKENEEIFKA